MRQLAFPQKITGSFKGPEVNSQNCEPVPNITNQYPILGISVQGMIKRYVAQLCRHSGSLKELVSHIKASWPETKGTIHIDAWREVTQVDVFAIRVKALGEQTEPDNSANRLFFLDPGGYKPGQFDEYHYKMLIPAANASAAIKQAKSSAFYLHTGFKGAVSHIDDKYGIDVDDVHDVADILPACFKEQYERSIEPAATAEETDAIHLGFLQLWKIP